MNSTQSRREKLERRKLELRSARSLTSTHWILLLAGIALITPIIFLGIAQHRSNQKAREATDAYSRAAHKAFGQPRGR